MNTGENKKLRIYTIGHSTLAFEPFVSLLKGFGIELLADIRRYPSSRKFPHFNRSILCDRLKAENIDYLWLEALGGRRHAPKNSKSLNAGLRSAGFRSYADYMATDGFRNAVQELISAAARSRTAVMCAEKLYWRCHRRILSDYLVSQGIEVIHIIESGKYSNHKLSAYAIATESGVIYPSQQSDEGQRSLFDLDTQTDP
ncbi:MAG: DUF488 domain-containing protein [Sedimentisphaerales bacterium]